ncbi:MAG: hypothetical protein KDA85_19020, partial [Planctomycetaceae bacterium]|nr:hypothetical protein [Planctomycetaceae bacterium]
HGPLESFCFNRLTEAAVAQNKEMEELMRWLSTRFARPVFMSGSGSTVFLIARSPREGTALRDRIAQFTGLPCWRLRV